MLRAVNFIRNDSRPLIRPSACFTLIGGWLVDVQPATVTLRGAPVDTMRVFFVAVVGLLLLTASAIRWLQPVREPRLDQAMAVMRASLPGPLALPFIPLHWYARYESRRRAARKP